MATMTATYPRIVLQSYDFDALQPLPIGIMPQFIATQPTTLTMKGDFSMFTGSLFNVKTMTRNGPMRILTIEGESWTPARSKTFYDACGFHLFTLNTDSDSATPKHYIEDVFGAQIAEIVWRRDSDEQADIVFLDEVTRIEVRLHLCGRKSGTYAEIKNSKTGQLLASRNSKITQHQLSPSSSSNSTLSVAENMDISLAVAAFMCLDEVLRVAR